MGKLTAMDLHAALRALVGSRCKVRIDDDGELGGRIEAIASAHIGTCLEQA